MTAVFKDETAEVFLLDEIAVPVLLRCAGCPSELGLQMPALDPARNGMGIDPQRRCQTVGGIEAPVVFERHSFQLEMDSGYGTGVPCGFSFEADSLIAHPRIPAGITNSRSLQGSSLVRVNPNSRARFFGAQCGMPTFLSQDLNARSRLRVSMDQITSRTS